MAPALVLAAVLGSPAQNPPITLDSLLAEMVDREALARFPDPPYTCKQFSSYDRASKTPDDPAAWFANGDSNHYLRTETHGGRREWVMADMDGPGAVVRIWSADPKGTMRVYLDGDEKPVIEAPMGHVLRGTWLIKPPLSQESARGCNLYLPIPYAKHCTITSDHDGFYYQVNTRTYSSGTLVKALSAADLNTDALPRVQGDLLTPRTRRPDMFCLLISLAPGESRDILNSSASGKVTAISLYVNAEDLPQALRSAVLTASFDGEPTIWCPIGDFFGSGIGANPYQDWTRSVKRLGERTALTPQASVALECDWSMPYLRTARLTVTNFGSARIGINYGLHVEPGTAASPDRLMHFHANWHAQYPIHALAGRGTMDWNYITATGKGVYVGDSLAVMNPVETWWGEGDEKIYVDGETFPSHFGTGTEDYYGFAWCDPHVFQHPFHAQPRVDGNGKNNWGHTTVTRVRSLDAIPFTKSLKFDMEVWHWAECDVAYAATTYWYALPGATCNIAPNPEGAKAPIPQPPPLPPPMEIAGAEECEKMLVAAKSEGLEVVAQDMSGFARRTWSADAHLWVKGRRIGDFVELSIRPTHQLAGPDRMTLYATKSWDYGIVRFTVNGKPAGPDGGAPIDLYSGEHKAKATGPIELGVFETREDGTLLLRAEVVGANPKAEGTRAFFGLDCVVVKLADR